jgi:ATP-dependent DNA helicase RecG
MLRKNKLVEGRRTNIYISKQIAETLHQEAEYTNLKGLDDKYFRDLILSALKQHSSLRRKDFNKLLVSKLPSSLNEKQKANKVEYLLRQLRKSGKIASDKHKIWHLADS